MMLCFVGAAVGGWVLQRRALLRSARRSVESAADVNKPTAPVEHLPEFSLCGWAGPFLGTTIRAGRGRGRILGVLQLWVFYRGSLPVVG